mgnify:CR=1 FL=1
MPAGQSQAYSTTTLSPSTLAGIVIPVKTDTDVTGTITYNTLISKIPKDISDASVPIAKLDFTPSTWDGVSAIGDYTNGLRLPDSAGVNMSGYGSTIVGVNAGRVADVGDPTGESLIPNPGYNTIFGHESGQRLSRSQLVISSSGVVIALPACAL